MIHETDSRICQRQSGNDIRDFLKEIVKLPRQKVTYISMSFRVNELNMDLFSIDHYFSVCSKLVNVSLLTSIRQINITSNNK